MIGLDTNVLVRLFAEDDPVQLDAAVRLIDGLPKDEMVMVNIVVVVELLWTLRRVYRFENDHLASVIRKLSEHPQIVLPERETLRQAAHRAKEEGGDIADHIIALLNQSLGCRTTYTFDERASREPDFTLIQ